MAILDGAASTAILDNTALYGGGVAAWGLISGFDIEGNDAALGGGVYAGGTTNLFASRVSGNSASGGGVAVESGATEFAYARSSTDTNTATDFGGGIYAMPGRPRRP